MLRREVMTKGGGHLSDAGTGRSKANDAKALEKFNLDNQEKQLKNLIESLVGPRALHNYEDEKTEPMRIPKQADALQKKLQQIKNYLEVINGGNISSKEQHLAKRVVNVTIMDIRVELVTGIQ